MTWTTTTTTPTTPPTMTGPTQAPRTILTAPGGDTFLHHLRFLHSLRLNYHHHYHHHHHPIPNYQL
jgi:hypothetical protein